MPSAHLVPATRSSSSSRRTPAHQRGQALAGARQRALLGLQAGDPAKREPARHQRPLPTPPPGRWRTVARRQPTTSSATDHGGRAPAYLNSPTCLEEFPQELTRARRPRPTPRHLQQNRRRHSVRQTSKNDAALQGSGCARISSRSRQYCGRMCRSKRRRSINATLLNRTRASRAEVGDTGANARGRLVRTASALHRITLSSSHPEATKSL